MTDIEILTNCINELARINIPMGLIEQVGIPVYNVRQELINLADNIIEKANQVKKEEAEQNKIRIIPKSEKDFSNEVESEFAEENEKCGQNGEVSQVTEENQNGSEA